MNIDGFSEKTAGQLFDDLKIDKFSDLYKLTVEKLVDLEGFKERKAENLISAIEKSKRVPLANFIFALGIEGVGKKTAKDLARIFGNVKDLANAEEEKLREIPDVGIIMAKDISDYFADEGNVAEINELFDCGVSPFTDEVKSEGKFKGEKVVLTGSLADFTRSEAQKIIESEGGETQSSVTKTTTLVIAGESAGSKLDKAKQLGIKIIDEDEFKNIIYT